MSERERERRRLGDRRRDDFVLILCAGKKLTRGPDIELPHFWGLPLLRRFVFIDSQSFKLV